MNALDNKLLQQIWRLVVNSVRGNGILKLGISSSGFLCSAAKQLNRALKL